MSDAEKIKMLSDALEEIRQATFGQFQLEAESFAKFNPRVHACPLCRRNSTAEHLRSSWALIQATAARALRETDEGA